MTVHLYRLPPGRSFRLPGSELTGTLLRVNDCRAVVRYNRPPKVREFTELATGRVVRFVEREPEESIAPMAEVELL